MEPFVFTRHQDFYDLTKKELWDFVSTPTNLAQITPDYMNFKIKSFVPAQMYAGMLIAYKVNVLPKIRMSWLTEITQLVDQEYFIDEQRFGPYKLWHHEHFLEKRGNGVRMVDKITYLPPLGVLGKWMNQLFIEKKLEEIFDYREYELRKIFIHKKSAALEDRTF